MKLNKIQRDTILAKIDVSSEIIGDVEYLYWNAGEASYNIGMKQTWTKDQKEYLDGMENRLRQEIRQSEEKTNSKIDLIIDILARNGMK